MLTCIESRFFSQITNTWFLLCPGNVISTIYQLYRLRNIHLQIQDIRARIFKARMLYSLNVVWTIDDKSKCRASETLALVSGIATELQMMKSSKTN